MLPLRGIQFPFKCALQHLSDEYHELKIGQLASAMLPLRSPRESPEVSWLENEVEALVVGDIDVFTDTLFGDKEVFGSDDPEFDVSDMEWPPIESEEPSDAKSEVGETESGVKPKSLK